MSLAEMQQVMHEKNVSMDEVRVGPNIHCHKSALRSRDGCRPRARSPLSQALSVVLLAGAGVVPLGSGGRQPATAQDGGGNQVAGHWEVVRLLRSSNTELRRTAAAHDAARSRPHTAAGVDRSG